MVCAAREGWARGLALLSRRDPPGQATAGRGQCSTPPRPAPPRAARKTKTADDNRSTAAAGRSLLMDLEFLCGPACQLSVSAGAGGDTGPSSEDGNIGFLHIVIVHNMQRN